MTDAQRQDQDHTTRPISSPINTAVVEMQLTDEMIAAGVVVLSDMGDGGLLRIRSLSERALARGRQVFHFASNDCGFNLPGVLRFGRGPNRLPIEPGDGAAIATILLKSGESAAFDFSEMNSTDTSRFLEGFLRLVNETKDAHIDIGIEALQDLIGRKRNHDRQTSKFFKSTLLRGLQRNGGNDVRYYVSASSPQEVPIETVRNTMTFILGPTGNPGNVEASSSFLKGDVRILRYATVKPWGASHMEDHHQWLYAFNARLQHLPLYCPLPALESGAGSRAPLDLKATDRENNVMKEVQEARKTPDNDNDGSGGLAAVAARRRTSIRRAAEQKRRIRFTPIPGDVNAFLELTAKGVPYASVLVTVARCALSIDAVGRIDTTLPIPGRAILDWVDANPLARSAVAYSYKRLKQLSPFGSPTAVALATLKGGDEAKTIFESLAGFAPTDASTASVMRALASGAGHPQEVLGIILAAVAASHPPAANDDVAVRQAV